MSTFGIINDPIFADLIDCLIAQTNEVVAASVLEKCAYAEPESSWGACDGGQQWCHEKGTITDLVTEITVCREHFADLERCF